ncbi:MAG: HAMP domain-containing sensor histidine kinase [Gemmataceae bacterium]
MLTVGVSALLFLKTQDLFRLNVNNRLVMAASLAASRFTPDELAGITGTGSVKTPLYADVVGKLNDIRHRTADLKFLYILRRTADPNTLSFVADADSLHPDQPQDLNGDGLINDEDAKAWPGDPYDISTFPQFREDAFVRPYVDPTISHDQWGSFLSGTAPITATADGGPTDYVIGLDMDVTEVERVLNTALVPFLGFVGFLFVVITLQAFALEKMWSLQVRQLEEIDRQKDELLGIVAHQLRNPITATNWSMESILDGDFGPIPPDAAGQLKEVEVKMKGLSELVELLVDVSKIELGRLAMNRTAVDLAEFFEQIVRNIVPQADAKTIIFVRSVPADLGQGQIDQRLTHMTVENLLSNAVKYTPNGGRVELTVTRVGQKLTIVVRDTGMGIPKADQGKIFGKLYRASNVLSLDGNGFGLYVAKGAIEQQGGTIGFESEEGHGTTFRVELPLTA